MNDIQIFNNPDFGEIRTVMINGEPWFAGKDVCKSLGYAKPVQAIHNNVDEDDSLRKGLTDNLGRTQETIVINESGLYSLIFGSKLESAKKFKKWVTSEVLPSLRKKGYYGAPMTTDDKIKLLAQGNIELKEKIETVDSKVENVMNELESLKMDLPILPIEAEKITIEVKSRGVEILGGKKSNAYNSRSLRQKVYNNLYGNLKYNFGIKTYKAIKRSEVDKAIEIIKRYEPPYFLAQEIENINNQLTIESL